MSRRDLVTSGTLVTVKPLADTVLIFSGTVSPGLGNAGVFLPVLPTTPFLLFAASGSRP